MLSWYLVLSRLPITATPRAPPTCMNALLVADPTPVSPLGSDPMTDSVAAGITNPTPTPAMMTPNTISAYPELAVTPEICQNAAATISSPAATVYLIPIFRMTSADSGAASAIAPAA